MGRKPPQIGVIGVAFGIVVGAVTVTTRAQSGLSREQCAVRETLPPQLRPFDCRLAALVADGLERSATLRKLPAAEQGSLAARTVSAALKLTDPHISSIPIVVSTNLLQGLSPGVEGWTTFGENGKAKSVFIYAGSETFRCAAKSREVTVCLMKLAAILVHEAWHFEHGPDEDGAYEAQIVFLVRIGVPPSVVSGVIKAHQTEMRRDRNRIHIHRMVAETQAAVTDR